MDYGRFTFLTYCCVLINRKHAERRLWVDGIKSIWVSESYYVTRSDSYESDPQQSPRQAAEVTNLPSCTSLIGSWLDRRRCIGLASSLSVTTRHRLFFFFFFKHEHARRWIWINIEPSFGLWLWDDHLSVQRMFRQGQVLFQHDTGSRTGSVRSVFRSHSS